MTSPPKEITVECPKCGRFYEDWYRASVNLDLDSLMTSILKVAQPQSAPTVSTKLTSTYSWLKTVFLC